MADLYQQVLDSLAECKNDHSLEAFRNWFDPIALDAEGTSDASLIELVHEVEGILAESSSTPWSTTDLLNELQKIAHLWARPQCDYPASSLMPASSGSLGSNATQFVLTARQNAA